MRMRDVPWSQIFLALTAGGAIFTGASVLVAYHGIKAEHDLNRRQYTFELIRIVNNELRVMREPLRQAFPDLYDDRKLKRLSKDEAEALFGACPAEEGKTDKQTRFSCAARGIAGDYLNLLELISVAYWNHVGDRSMIERSFGGLILDDYAYFENFIQHVSEIREREPKAWAPLQNMVNDLRSQTHPPASPDRTGG